jgi:hypothetical protein
MLGVRRWVALARRVRVGRALVAPVAGDRAAQVADRVVANVAMVAGVVPRKRLHAQSVKRFAQPGR